MAPLRRLTLDDLPNLEVEPYLPCPYPVTDEQTIEDDRERLVQHYVD